MQVETDAEKIWRCTLNTARWMIGLPNFETLISLMFVVASPFLWNTWHAFDHTPLSLFETLHFSHLHAEFHGCLHNCWFPTSSVFPGRLERELHAARQRVRSLQGTVDSQKEARLRMLRHTWRSMKPWVWMILYIQYSGWYIESIRTSKHPKKLRGYRMNQTSKHGDVTDSTQSGHSVLEKALMLPSYSKLTMVLKYATRSRLVTEQQLCRFPFRVFTATGTAACKPTSCGKSRRPGTQAKLMISCLVFQCFSHLGHT